ncbi:PH domain-containing protein [Microbacterium sp. RD1]|uniref:PH domain-containing protein n=1 Tax=Microbacterium sp. RD1 TaxID=3457313 RepID=UPI003FA5BF2A
MSDVDAPAPPAPEVRSPLSDGEWHRMHPLTPLLRGGLFLLVIAGVILANMRERIVAIFVPIFTPGIDVDTPPDPIDYLVDHNLILVAGAVLLVLLAVLLVIFWLSWRFHTFRITGDDVEVRSGVLFRTHRRAPLDRVQGVNLTRPLVARLVGMAKLEVVGAGSDGNVKLEYLSTPHAETIRADILRLASGRQLAEASAEAEEAGARRGPRVVAGINGLLEGEDADAAEPASIVHIPPLRLAASRLLSSSTLGLLFIVAVLVVGSVFDVPWVFFAFIPAAIGFIAYALRSFVRALRYSIAPTPGGVRITFGLFTTVTEILPPGRVHALEVRQSPLWRPFGWWSIRVNRISGRASSDATAEQLTTVLPVGTHDDVERVLRLLLPTLAPDDEDRIFTQGIDGPGDDDPYTTTPARARLLRPLAWRRNGFALTSDALLLRRGALWRSLGIFPLARLQSVGISQGPVDRALNVANLTAHVVAGTVTTTVGILDRDEAVGAFERTAEAVVAAAAQDRSHRWAQ